MFRTAFCALSLVLLAACSPAAWAAPVRVASDIPYISGSSPGGAAILGNVVIFTGTDFEPWRSDGTPAGTYRLKDINPGAAAASPLGFTAGAGFVFFSAYEGASFTPGIWRTDGTPGGTVKLLAGIEPRAFTAAGSYVYFTTDDSPNGYAIWRSDGTVAGTAKIQNGFNFPEPSDFTAVGSTVFFAAQDDARGRELWKTDGTPGGTALVRDIEGGTGSSHPVALRSGNDALLFVARVYSPDKTSYQTQMFRSDGTEAGTYTVRELPGGFGSGAIPDAFSICTGPGGIVYFPGRQDGGDTLLWRTDGTFGGTYAVSPTPTLPQECVRHGNDLYFKAWTSDPQWQLWRSNGTQAGTFQLTGLTPQVDAVLPRPIGGAFSEVYFWAMDLAGPERLRSTRGSPGDSVIVATLTDTQMSWAQTSSQGLFYATDNSSATELWFIPSGDPAADADGDGIPNVVEPGEARDVVVKDNDVFGIARLFAMQQYRDFLGREGDAGGVTFHEQNITSNATTRVQVIEGFLASPEFQNGLPQVTRLYFAFFSRIPDYAGLMFQVAAYRSGAPIEGIAQNFSLSPEFTNRYGSLTNEQYVDLVYQNVLGRPADSGGRAYYLERLGDGRLTRGQMMIGFSESPEFQQLIGNEVHVTAVYVGMLRRAPDAGGMAFYVDQIEGGMPRNAIINGFLGSPEYRNRFLP